MEKDHWGRLTTSPDMVEPLMYRAGEVIRYLLSFPAGQRIGFEQFGYGLLSALSLQLVTTYPSIADTFMYVAIALSMLEPLELFGVISVVRAPDKYGHDKIVAFQMTELGLALLSDR
ncbi:MAG: hypothetical protein ACYC56_06935 [Candidatus Aquicultor sp.]